MIFSFDSELVVMEQHHGRRMSGSAIWATLSCHSAAHAVISVSLVPGNLLPVSSAGSLGDRDKALHHALRE
jgi:hypothetical protein